MLLPEVESLAPFLLFLDLDFFEDFEDVPLVPVEVSVCELDPIVPLVLVLVSELPAAPPLVLLPPLAAPDEFPLWP